MVSAISSASSSSEYSWSESRLKSGDLNSSRIKVLKCLLDDRNSHSDRKKLARESNRKTRNSVSVSDDRYAVSNGSGYAVLICLSEYAVLDRGLDMPYSAIDQNSVLRKNN
ncbi:hypothetical protein Tco_1267325 [Tanacetum coccineum]